MKDNISLKKFKEKDKKKIGIILFTVCCILLIAGVLLYQSFALFETHQDFNVIRGNVEDPGDLYFAFYVDGVISKTMPQKGESYAFESGVCNNGATVEFNTVSWSPIIKNMTKTHTKCTLYFVKESYKESMLNGTDPVIKEGLIPVTIEENGTVKKADVNSKWYSYEEKKWANAIILKEDSHSYEIGEVIPEDAIESYFVWIPRYRYQIFDEGNYPSRGSDTSVLDSNAVQTIQVVFENKSTTPSTGSTVGSWLTHPAFTSLNSNGIWVGKFETGTTLTSNYNVRNGEAVQIKPNVSSWRDIEVASAFYTSYDYKRNLDSHMMKNTEWGAVAYLQHSIYGSRTSVRINNNSSYITGYAANNEPTCGLTGTNEECNKYCNDGSCNVAYNTTTGYLASTTGNISGIYDMSGGSWEYIMGVMLDETGNPASGRNSTNHSGFNGTLTCPTCDSDTSGKTSITDGYAWPEAKYYDAYAYQTSDQHYERRILGDATSEMGPFGITSYATKSRTIGSWYQDQGDYVYSKNPWLMRGGGSTHGLYTGMFAFGTQYGLALSWISFRVVLSP